MRSLPRFALVLLLSTSLVSACGGLLGEESSDSADSGSAGDPAGDNQLSDGGVVSVGQTFWHSGFQVEIVDATVAAGEDDLGQPSPSLTLGAAFTNLGDSEASFAPQVAVVSGSASYPIGSDSELPDVPSGLSGEGTLAFPIDDGFDLATAYLAVGAAEENRAQVPIGPEGGELVDLAPSEVPLSGKLSVEVFDFTFTAAELRADLPSSYAEVEQGSLALTLTFTATSRYDGLAPIWEDDFALILPSGTAVGPDASELDSVPGNESGVDTEGQRVRFLIPDPPAGDYTVRYTFRPEFFTGGYSQADGTYEFSL